MSATPAGDRLQTALDLIADRNEALKLVTALDVEGARAAAAASDRRGQPLGPLDGRVVGIKDNIAVKGLAHTGGLAGWRDRIASADARVVGQLRAAGAVVIGTLNMHEAALGATTDNPTFGRAANPLDPERTTGGSSGGSGGAVAAGFVDAALGTDTLGSVRLPAAYCGVCGLKTTYDAVSEDGLTLLSPSFDTIGPLARDAATLLAVFEAMRRPLSRTATLPGLSSLRVGVPRRQLSGVETEREVADAFERAIGGVEASGARVVDIDLDGWHPARARRGALQIVEAEAAVELAPLLEVPDAMSDDLRAMLDYGAGLGSTRMVEAMARVRAARLAILRALAGVDVVMMPTTPQRAFRHDAPVPDGQADLTALANMAGLPAISLPVSCPVGLPASVQFIGPDWTEAALCRLGQRLERGFLG